MNTPRIAIKTIFFCKRIETRFRSSSAELAKYKPLFAVNAQKCDWTELTFFAHIHTAITEFYSLKDLESKQVLHLEQKEDPCYMSFLRDRYKANIFGIDTDKTFVDQARQGGKINFPDKSIDIVVSRNFLDDFSLTAILGNTTQSFIKNVISEVYRVLRPEGRFFSHLEDMLTPELSSNFRSFTKMYMDFSDASASIFPVKILQK
jgi:SAM-dependent methyltransferase